MMFKALTIGTTGLVGVYAAGDMNLTTHENWVLMFVAFAAIGLFSRQGNRSSSNF